MSLHQFFLDHQIIDQGCFDLDLSPDDMHHAKVLRLKVGEHIAVIDADGIYFECEILDVAENIKVRICKREEKADDIEICLISGLAKSTKFDDVVKSCTEIGVNEFVPTEFDRSVVKLDKSKIEKRVARWQKIAKSAAMQAGRLSIPLINSVVKIKDLEDKLGQYDAIYVFWEEATDKEILRDISYRNVAVVVGPEGGITKEEIDVLKSYNPNTFIVSLGNNILRCETANIVASTIVKFNAK